MADIQSKYLHDATAFFGILPRQLNEQLLINPCDAYSSYTYRLTFSMLPFSFWATSEVELDPEKGGRIIIAQTGVTKFTIDNLQINSVVHPNPPPNLVGNMNRKYRFSFELTEPFGMSYIDLINRVQYELNKSVDYPNTPPLQRMPYLMEIELIGHEDPVTEGDELFGEVFYHTAIPFRVVNFDMDPGVAGTVYSFDCVSINEMTSSADASVTNVAKEMIITTENGTVNELLADFTKQMQEQQKGVVADPKNVEDADSSVKYHKGTYQLDEKNGIPGHPDIFKKLQIDADYLENNMASKKLKEFGAVTMGKVEADQQAGKKDPANDGRTKGLQITIKEGAKATDVMKELASLNHVYAGTVHRYKMAEETADFDANAHFTDQTQYTQPGIREKYKWDGTFTDDGDFAYEFVYELTGKLDSTGILDPEELRRRKEDKDPDLKAATDRGISKMYAYQYTAMNDQIYDIDLKVSNGIRYLRPAFGGQQANYTQSPAAAISKAGVEKMADFRTKAKPNTALAILDKFEQLATDIKGVLTSLVMLPISLTEDIAALASGLKPTVSKPNVKNLVKLNNRLPSSPIAIIQKSKTIGELTSQVESLAGTLNDLTEEIEGALSDLLQDQISKITAKAFTPFAVLDSAFNKIAEGVGGFIEEIENKVGDIGLDQFGIDTTGLLDEAKEKLELFKTETSSTTPSGFNPGVNRFEGSDNFDSLYMEEFEFDEKEYGFQTGEEGSPFGVYDTVTHGMAFQDPCTPPSSWAHKSIFSTMLSNSILGAPYMYRINLSIKGDPYWMGKPSIEVGKTKFVHTAGVEYFGDEESDIKTVRKEEKETNVAPYGMGEVGFFFAYMFPREYDTWSDDPSRHTGEMKDLSMNKSFSGQFIPYRVIHMFSGGMFRQSLEAIKVTYKGQLAGEIAQKELNAAIQAEREYNELSDNDTLFDSIGQNENTPTESDTQNNTGYNGPGPGGGGNNAVFDPGV